VETGRTIGRIKKVLEKKKDKRTFKPHLKDLRTVSKRGKVRDGRRGGK